MRLKRLLVLLVGIIVFLMIAYFMWTLNSVYPGSALLLGGVLAFFYSVHNAFTGTQPWSLYDWGYLILSIMLLGKGSYMLYNHFQGWYKNTMFNTLVYK